MIEEFFFYFQNNAGGASGKELTCQCIDVRDAVQSLSWEVPLEKGMATHFSILTWRIPLTEEPGRLPSIDSQRVGHD